MMKKIIFFILLVPFLGTAQFKSDNGKLYFEKIYEVELSKPEIKDKINQWIAVNFNDSNNVIKMNTEERIVTNGMIENTYSYNNMSIPAKIKYSLITEFKDGKFRVLFDNLTIHTTTGNEPILADQMSFEYFKDIYKKQIELVPESYRKTAMKDFNDESKLRAAYSSGLIIQGKITAIAKENIESITADIYSYVNKEKLKNSDW